MKYGKLGQGVLVKVPSALVKRRKAHFFNLSFGASAILGCNGYVWVSTIKSPNEEETEGGGYIQHTEVSFDLLIDFIGRFSKTLYSKNIG